MTPFVPLPLLSPSPALATPPFATDQPLPPRPPPFDEAPPRRSAFPRGEEGRAKFRSKRAAWYHQVTGACLAGDVAEQNELFDKIARRYRAYSDGRLTEREARMDEEIEDDDRDEEAREAATRELYDPGSFCW